MALILPEVGEFIKDTEPITNTRHVHVLGEGGEGP